MAGAQFCLRTVPGFGGLTDQSNVSRQIWSSLTSSSSSSPSPSPLRLSFQLGFRHRHCRKSQLILISCKSSRRFGDKSNDAVEPDHEYLEAFVLISGEFAVETLIDSSSEDESWECTNQFQFMRSLVEKLGYGVTMVRITERVVNTYFARIYFCKPGEKEILSVDARPSDAINVAKRCRAPIYVNKQIILTDGIKFAYRMGRMRDTKSIYDVSLDGAADGPDSLAEELDLVRNMNLAIHEERYSDAAVWRDKLMKLREPRRDH